MPFGLGFGIGALVLFVKNLVNVGDQLSDLSDRTGVTIAVLGGLRPLVGQFGVSLEQFAKGVLFAQKNLGIMDEDSKGAAEALKQLGLNINELKAASPDEFLERFAKGLASVEDRNLRAAAATRVMGKAGAELIPVLLRIAEEGLPRLSAEAVKGFKALGELADWLTKATGEAANFWAALLGRGITQGFTPQQELLRGISEDIKETVNNLKTLKIAEEERGLSASKSLIANIAAAETRLKALRVMELRALRAVELPVSGKPPPDLIPDPELIKKSAVVELEFRKQIFETQTELVKLTQNEEVAAKAAIEYAEAVALEKIAHDKLNPALAVYIRQLTDEKTGLLDAQLAQKKKNEENEREIMLGDLRVRIARGVRQAQDDQINTTKQLGDLEADKLQLLGQTTDAERRRIEVRIEELRARKQIADERGESTKIFIAQIDLEEERMRRLGAVTLNLGSHVANTLETIFDAMLRGTLKGIDVLKAGTAFLGNIVTDIFRQTLQKKLAFETTLFSNIQGIPAQASQALAAGGVSVGGGGGAGGGGGIGDLLSNFLGLGGLSQSIGLNQFVAPFVGGLNEILPTSLAMTTQGFLGSLGAAGLGAGVGAFLPSLFPGLSKGARTGIGVASGALTGFIASGFNPIGLLGGLGGLFGLFGGGDRRAGSAQRRAAAASAGLQSTQAGGFQLTQEEVNALSAFMASGASPGPLKSRSVALIVAQLEGLRAKGGRAMSSDADEIMQAELARRGLPTGKPAEIFKVFQEQEKQAEFLNAAMAQSTELFGRGLIAALEAASESEAQAAFLRTLGEGAQQILFQGITEAFMASAQFGDLLTPIQQTIRQFTEEAIKTGKPPDITRFRTAILPGIESLVTRGDVLAPLIAELQRLRQDIGKALPLSVSAGGNNISITINGNVSGEEDVRDLARRIADLLSGEIAPGT